MIMVTSKLKISLLTIALCLVLGLVSYHDVNSFNSGGEYLMEITAIKRSDLVHPERLTLENPFSELNKEDFVPLSQYYDYDVGDTLYIPLWIFRGGPRGTEWKSGGNPYCQNPWPYSRIPPTDDCPQAKVAGAHAFLKGKVVEKAGDRLRVEYGIEEYVAGREKDRTFDLLSDHYIAARVEIDSQGNGTLEQVYIDGEAW